MTEASRRVNAGAAGPTARDRGVVLALAMVPALVAGVAGAALVASWRDDLPNPVATHWSSDGADGFSAPGFVVAAPIVIGVLGALLSGVLCARSTDRSIIRSVVGIVAGVAFSTIGIVVLTTSMQRGVSDAADVGTPQWQIGCALAVGVVCGIGLAAAVPGWRTDVSDDVGVRPELMLGAGERFMWTRAVSMSAGASVILGVAMVVLTTLTVVLRSWIVLAALVLVVAASLLVWTVRVTVDQSGVSIRGRLGWPRTYAPMATIDHAEVVSVRALRDFGGFGYRISVRGDLKGVKGFVFRSGSALLVVRCSGAREVVVVDDARTAAGLINHVVRHGGPAAPR